MSYLDLLASYWRVKRAWPASKALLDQWRKQFKSRADFEKFLKTSASGGSGSPTVPHWMVRLVATEIGQNAAYLAIPEIAPILITGAAESWESGKLQARIEQTTWWKNTTSRQREWTLLSDAEKTQTINTWKATTLDLLYTIYGREEVARQGWTINSPQLTSWATRLASGRDTIETFTFSQRTRAEGISGTPAWQKLQEESSAIAKPGNDIENLSRQLEDKWREYMGDSYPPPQSMSRWASDIYYNRRSEDDYLDYLEQIGASLYPNKPPKRTYREWIEPAKQIIGATLELGTVDDSDALVRSYMNGQITDLAALQDRARHDARYGRTQQAHRESRSVADAIGQAWGVV